METTINRATSLSYNQSATETVNLWTRFMNCAKGQERALLLWVGVILAAHGCILTPMVVKLTLLAEPNFILFMTAMVAMSIALVTNLAAMPTKVTILAFALSILIDIAIVAACFVLMAA